MTTGTIEERFRTRTPGSAARDEVSQRSMPGGNTRSAAYHWPYPLTMVRGEGPHLWDIDGNQYIDLLGNFSSLVHGHAYPPIVQAAQDALKNGTAWPAGSEAQQELASLLSERIASIELVRFCNSGTEAGMLAARVARAHTGRPLLLKARSGYHGSYDDLETEGSEQTTLVAEFGDAGSFERVLEEHGDRIAAVFLEPVQGAGTFRCPTPQIARISEATRRAGSLLVLDEVITFRLAEGGAQGGIGLSPDLTMLGKIVGGGFPVGVLGGKRAVMERFDPRCDDAIFHSGTFNGNPVTCAAGVVSVRELTSSRIARMEEQASVIQEVLTSRALALSLPCQVTRAGSLLTIFFEEEVPLPPAERGDDDALSRFHLACLVRGIFIATRGMIALSTVISAAVLDDVLQRFDDALSDMAREWQPA